MVNIWGWFVVILVTSLAVILGFARLLGRGLAEYDRIILLDQQAAAVPELPRAGRFDVEYLPGPPFAGASDRGYELVDTGPLLILSEHAAALDAHEREVRAMIEAAKDLFPYR